MNVATEKLKNLGLYSQVHLQLEPTTDKPGNECIIVADIQDKKRHILSIGTTVGTAPNDKGNLEINFNKVNDCISVKIN